ncbi:MAG: hypothetical protein JSW58_10630 [Candidatus Latescibacterota bacterium]|nr:MAG: hypothetical protein JSW58_10630 [Candidatus Latescibacterota bacterium]
MRVFPRILLAFVLAVVLASPGALMAQQLPLPMQKAIPQGITTVEYAQQTLVFTTSVPLIANFQFISENEIEVRVRTRSSGQQGGNAPGNILRIWWEEGDEFIYDGEPPEEEWSGILLTEGGFTEK